MRPRILGHVVSSALSYINYLFLVISIKERSNYGAVLLSWRNYRKDFLSIAGNGACLRQKLEQDGREGSRFSVSVLMLIRNRTIWL